MEAAAETAEEDGEVGTVQPRDPMQSLQRQKTLLFESGPIAYLMDDPVRGALLVLLGLAILSSLLGGAKRLLWTGKVITVPVRRLRVLEAAEEELRTLVGDVREHVGRVSATRGTTTQVVVGTAKGVVGGTGRVVKRTAIPEL